MTKSKLTGRGAGSQMANRFEKERVEPFFEDLDMSDIDNPVRTKYFEIHPKTIVNQVPSKDVPADYSINPYQGCEHGCSYCYARPTHEYWGYGPALDFEQNILVKKTADELLKNHFDRKTWRPSAIMLSGNTDCYQPIERKLGITRSLLKVFAAYRNPVGIITKNSLILRDLDILADLHRDNLVHVNISLNTLNDGTRRRLEPRAASVQQRLRTIKELSQAGIPVNVLFAPVVPGLTDHEILPLAEAVAGLGAKSIGHIILRLNGPVEMIFSEWLENNYPDRANKILNAVKDCHGGSVSDSRTTVRMKGVGERAKAIGDSMKLAQKRFFPNSEPAKFNLKAFKRPLPGQLDLF